MGIDEEADPAELAVSLTVAIEVIRVISAQVHESCDAQQACALGHLGSAIGVFPVLVHQEPEAQLCRSLADRTGEVLVVPLMVPKEADAKDGCTLRESLVCFVEVIPSKVEGDGEGTIGRWRGCNDPGIHIVPAEVEEEQRVGRAEGIRSRARQEDLPPGRF